MWEDVKDIEVLQIKNQKYISIKLKDPEKFIEKSRRLKRFLLRRNYKRYSSPILISNQILKYDFAKLHYIFKQIWRASN